MELSEYILLHPTKPWDWHRLSGNPNIPIKVIEQYSARTWYTSWRTCKWDWNWVSANSSVTMEYIEAHPEKLWNWYYVSQNTNMTIEYIEAHLELPWNWVA